MYGTICKTKQGDIVKSIGEKTIANYLFNNNIKYIYEKPITVNKFENNTRKIIMYCDFYLLQYKTYIEYWGLVNVNDTKLQLKYRNKMIWKQQQYYQQNLKLINIYPTDLVNLYKILKL